MLSIPEREDLANYICGGVGDSDHHGVLQRQIASIDLMVSLCDKRETRKRLQRKVNSDKKFISHQDLSSKHGDTQIKEESPGLVVQPPVDPFPLLLDPRQCPDCFGDERLTAEERAFRYCRTTVRDDYFDHHHLVRRERAVQQGEAIHCEHPKCKDLTFEHLDHFKNHVVSVHGVWLRCSQRVENRRIEKARRRQMAKAKAST